MSDEPPALHPAVQAVRKDGLLKFYHVHRWGTPLEDGQCGPVQAANELRGNASDDEDDDTWRRDECEARMRRRPEVSSEHAAFMVAWNAHVATLAPRLVSDRMLPEACRKFAQAHAGDLCANAALYRPWKAHLEVLWDHNLLHRDDVQDCLQLPRLLVDAAGDGDDVACPDCARPKHASHCALHGRTRGAAAWPGLQNGAVVPEHTASLLAATVRPKGVWEAATHG